MQTFSLLNKTRGKSPRIPFRKIKDSVLGRSYELSLALITATEARALTKRLKKKDKASNVLAFPLGKNSGEVVLCPATARKQAKEYGYAPPEFLAFLFIHGLLHLKGLSHGATMEKLEQRLLKRFGFAS